MRGKCQVKLYVINMAINKNLFNRSEKSASLFLHTTSALMSLIFSFLSFVQMRSCSWTAVPSVLLTSPLTSRGSLPSFQVKLLFLSIYLLCLGVWGLHLLYFVILLQFICCLSNCFLSKHPSYANGLLMLLTTLLYYSTHFPPYWTFSPWWFCLICLRKIEQTNKDEKSI